MSNFVKTNKQKYRKVENLLFNYSTVKPTKLKESNKTKN